MSLDSVQDVLGRWTLLDLVQAVIKWIHGEFLLFLSSLRFLFRQGEGGSCFIPLSATAVCCVVNRMAKKKLFVWLRYHGQYLLSKCFPSRLEPSEWRRKWMLSELANGPIGPG